MDVQVCMHALEIIPIVKSQNDLHMQNKELSLLYQK